MRKSWIVGLLSLAIGVLLGISIQGRKLGGQIAKNAVNDRTYRMVVPYNSWPGWSVSARAMERMAHSVPGVRTAVSGPSDGDSTKQIEELELLIKRKVNGIILCPGDDKRALIPTVNAALSNGIPVVTMYDDVPDSARLTFIAADERATAQSFAKRTFQKLKPSAPTAEKIRVLVAYMGPTVANQVQRLEGVEAAAKEAQEWVQLIDKPAEDKASEVVGAKEISTILRREQSRGGIQLIMGLDARSAIGAITALKENNISVRKVMVTGWDADEDVLLAIKDGWVESVSAPNAGFMTQLAMSVLEAHELGYLYPDALGLQQMDMKALPLRINIEPIVIDGSNVDAFFRKK